MAEAVATEAGAARIATAKPAAGRRDMRERLDGRVDVGAGRNITLPFCAPCALRWADRHNV